MNASHNHHESAPANAAATMPSADATTAALHTLDVLVRANPDVAMLGSPALRPFASSMVPDMSLGAFAARLVRYTGSTHVEVGAALALLGRFLRATDAALDGMSVHRLLGAAFVVAVKLLHDRLPLTFAQLGLVVGVSSRELAYLERRFVAGLALHLHVSSGDVTVAISALAWGPQTLAAAVFVGHVPPPPPPAPKQPAAAPRDNAMNASSGAADCFAGPLASYAPAVPCGVGATPNLSPQCTVASPSEDWDAPALHCATPQTPPSGRLSSWNPSRRASRTSLDSSTQPPGSNPEVHCCWPATHA